MIPTVGHSLYPLCSQLPFPAPMLLAAVCEAGQRVLLLHRPASPAAACRRHRSAVAGRRRGRRYHPGRPAWHRVQLPAGHRRWQQRQRPVCVRDAGREPVRAGCALLGGPLRRLTGGYRVQHNIPGANLVPAGGEPTILHLPTCFPTQHLSLPTYHICSGPAGLAPPASRPAPSYVRIPENLVLRFSRDPAPFYCVYRFTCQRSLETGSSAALPQSCLPSQPPCRPPLRSSRA